MIGKLSNRLRNIADFVDKGRIVADIGTDHGYVPIYLVSEGICPRAIAIDVNEGPLERAKEHIAENGLSSKIETRLSDGLAALKPGEASTIIIAGMGGLLMKKILAQGLGAVYVARELILSPQSDLVELRSYLKAQTIGIVDEKLVKEDGKFYWILKCVPHRGSAGCKIPQAVTDRYGEVLFGRKDEVLKEYLHAQVDKFTALLQEMTQNGTKEDNLQSVREELAAAEEGLRIIEG